MTIDKDELTKLMSQVVLKKPRNFIMGVKGKNVALLLSKKPIKPAQKQEVKAETGGSATFEGVCVKDGQAIVFSSLERISDSLKTPMKEYVKAMTGLSVKAEFKQVTSLTPVDEQDEEDAKGAKGPSKSNPPHAFDGERILYPSDTKTKISSVDFDLGAVLKAMVADLKANGIDDPGMFKIDAAAARKAVAHGVKESKRDTYVQVGVWKNGSLILQVRDANDAKWGSAAELRKQYTATIASEKAKSNAVINADKGDGAIDRASAAQGERFGVTPTEPKDTDLKKITGNIVLTAHGTPQEVVKGAGAGRVIGSHLANAKPDAVVDFLIRSGLQKDFKGKLTLAGCYTGAGGPSAVKAEQTFAERVSADLKKKGYKTVEIISYPGTTITDSGGGLTDSFGEKAGKGREVVDVATQTVKGDRAADAMSSKDRTAAEKDLKAKLKDYEKQRSDLKKSIAKNQVLVEKAMGKASEKSFEARVKLLNAASTSKLVGEYSALAKTADEGSGDQAEKARVDAREKKKEVVALAAKIFKGGGGSYEAQVKLLESDKFKGAVQAFLDDKKAMADLEELIATSPNMQVANYEGKVNRQGR